MVTSTRFLLAAPTARRFEGVVCYTAHVAGAFCSASVDPDERSCGAPPTQWQPRNCLDGRGVILKLRTSLYGVRTAQRRQQEHFNAVLWECSSNETCWIFVFDDTPIRGLC